MSFCQHCGAQTAPDDQFCQSCGINLHTGQPMQDSFAPIDPNQYNQAPPTIENHLAKAIFSTLCCCLPLGIAAIVQASKVNSLMAAGNYQGAQEAAKKADDWSNISIGIGAVLVVLRIIMEFAR